jgi:hypothetical protein
MKRSFHTSFSPTVECRQLEAKEGVDNNNSSVFTFTEILVLERIVCGRDASCLEIKSELSSPQLNLPFTERAGELTRVVSVLMRLVFLLKGL